MATLRFTVDAVMEDAESFYRSLYWEADLYNFDPDQDIKADLLAEYVDYAVGDILGMIRSDLDLLVFIDDDDDWDANGYERWIARDPESL